MVELATVFNTSVHRPDEMLNLAYLYSCIEWSNIKHIQNIWNIVNKHIIRDLK